MFTNVKGIFVFKNIYNFEIINSLVKIICTIKFYIFRYIIFYNMISIQIWSYLNNVNVNSKINSCDFKPLRMYNSCDLNH